MVLLDSTVLIDVLRGRAGTLERVRRLRAGGHVPCTSAINVEEIYRGLREAERSAALELFDGLQVLAIGRSEGELAGAWRRDFAARGRTLAQPDCLIAAVAVRSGVPLATGNPKHFPMQDLVVQHWPVGD